MPDVLGLLNTEEDKGAKELECRENQLTTLEGRGEESSKRKGAEAVGRRPGEVRQSSLGHLSKSLFQTKEWRKQSCPLYSICGLMELCIPYWTVCQFAFCLLFLRTKPNLHSNLCTCVYFSIDFSWERSDHLLACITIIIGKHNMITSQCLFDLLHSSRKRKVKVYVGCLCLLYISK